MTKIRAQAYLYLTLVALIWGIGASVVKYTLTEFEPLVFLSYRFFISSIITLIIFRNIKIKTKNVYKYFPSVILFGLLSSTFALGALFYGLDRSTVLDLNIVNTLSPLLIAFGGAKLFHDRITRREKVGILIAVSGTVFALFIPLLGNNTPLRITGNIFLVVYVLSDVSAMLLAKWLMRKRLQALVLSGISFIVGFITLSGFLLTMYQPTEILNMIINAPLVYHFGVFYMALFAGTVAYTLLVRAQRSLEVSEAGLFMYLSPVFATIVAVLWLGEVITPYFIIGAVIIAIGVILAEYKQPRHKKIAKHIGAKL